jgi:hypothetical protein
MRGSYFMKVRLLAVMALVVVGAMAGTSPAMAANKKATTSVSKAWQNQHKDNKAFGDAIHNLRNSVDSTNGALTSVTKQALAALTALQGGLTGLAASYTNFQYGVVQLSYGTNCTNTTCLGIYGASAPMLVTPRLDPTSAQSVASARFRVPPAAAGGGGAVKATATVRAVDAEGQDALSTAFCRVTAQGSGAATDYRTTAPNTSLKNLPAMPLRRSPLVPTDESEKVASLVSLTTDDKKVAVNLLAPELSWNGFPTAAGGTTDAISATGGDTIEVTLSCMYIANKTLRDGGITPPFAS